MSLLTVSGLRAGYGPVEVLHGIDLQVDEGEISVVLGANGAGKTTLLRALSGMISARGEIAFDDRNIIGMGSETIAAQGVSHVPQGRGTFPDMTVEDNLKVGGYRLGKSELPQAMQRWYEMFPRLAERCKQPAGSLSGGEQQMLAIARALMPNPRLLLLDEPSLGLAPKITQGLFEQLKQINLSTRTTILVVEQNAHLALAIGSHAVVIESGRIAVQGRAEDLASDDSVRKAYLGY